MSKKTREANKIATAKYGKIIDARKARRRCMTNYDPLGNKDSAMNMSMNHGELLLTVMATMQMFG